MQVFECNVSINMYEAYVFVNHVLLIYNTRNIQGIKDEAYSHFRINISEVFFSFVFCKMMAQTIQSLCVHLCCLNKLV